MDDDQKTSGDFMQRVTTATLHTINMGMKAPTMEERVHLWADALNLYRCACYFTHLKFCLDMAKAGNLTEDIPPLDTLQVMLSLTAESYGEALSKIQTTVALQRARNTIREDAALAAASSKEKQP